MRHDWSPEILVVLIVFWVEEKQSTELVNSQGRSGLGNHDVSAELPFFKEEYPVAKGILAMVVSKKVSSGSKVDAIKCKKVNPAGPATVN
jgi:hypothetical protein